MQLRRQLMYEMFFTTPKKKALLLEIDRVNSFYHSPVHMVDCVLGQVFLIKKKQNQKQKSKKAKASKRNP